jgi:hypothetical protein
MFCLAVQEKLYKVWIIKGDIPRRMSDILVRMAGVGIIYAQGPLSELLSGSFQDVAFQKSICERDRPEAARR